MNYFICYSITIITYSIPVFLHFLCYLVVLVHQLVPRKTKTFASSGRECRKYQCSFMFHKKCRNHSAPHLIAIPPYNSSFIILPKERRISYRIIYLLGSINLGNLLQSICFCFFHSFVFTLALVANPCWIK